LPTTWLNRNIGPGLATASATYSSSTFTISGAGTA
jgi:hypothetical protein